MIKIWCISDTHCRHHELKIPKNIDLIIHSGDCSNSLNRAINSNEVANFFEWFNSINIPKIFVPGNHDTSIESGLFKPTNSDLSCILIDESVNFDGINIYGSPYTPSFSSNMWAYHKSRSKMHIVWDNVPENTNILITHGPPIGTLDLAENIEAGQKIATVGCRSLYKKVLKIKPGLHIFGHIHSRKELNNYGIRKYDKTTFVNCACCTHYDKFYNGVVIDYDPIKGKVQW